MRIETDIHRIKDDRIGIKQNMTVTRIYIPRDDGWETVVGWTITHPHEGGPPIYNPISVSHENKEKDIRKEVFNEEYVIPPNIKDQSSSESNT